MKKRFNLAAVGFIVLIILVVTLLMSSSLRRTSHVRLPDVSKESSGGAGSSQYGEDAVKKIEIMPDTVQYAIETLLRPEVYERILVVEWVWGDTSAISQNTVRVSGELTRVDSIRADGKIRHVVTNGKRTAIWYDEEEDYFIGNAGDVSADEEQSIPTYEDILRLDVREIAAADYRVFSEESCIFVETVPDDFDIVQRYWVSVSNGLLMGAERLENGVTFYRMAAQQTTTEETSSPETFLLPDGTSLNNA